MLCQHLVWRVHPHEGVGVLVLCLYVGEDDHLPQGLAGFAQLAARLLAVLSSRAVAPTVRIS
jgi:hypothetical protein